MKKETHHYALVTPKILTKNKETVYIQYHSFNKINRVRKCLHTLFASVTLCS